MFDSDIQKRASEILARRRETTAAAIDAASLHAATHRPVIMNKFVSNTLGGLMGLLSGADYNSNKIGDFYNQALARLLNSTGSPAARQFGQEEQQSLQPMFNQQNQALAAKEAAMGITNSGAAKADYSDLAGQQSRALAGAVAPLYESAIGSYGSLAGAEPGAQANAYQDALNSFQNSLMLAATGVPGGTGTQSQIAGGYTPNPYSPNSVYTTPYGDYTLAPTGETPDANPYAGTVT